MTPEDCQVLVTSALFPSLEKWLNDRGLELVRTPFLDSEDDLPIYIVGIR